MPDPIASKPAPPFRWKLGVAILMGGALIETGTWFAIAPDRTYQVFSSLFLVPLTVLLLLLWWLFGSGLRWTTRGIGLGICVLCAAIGIGLFRVEGFSGEMLPVFVPRWRPTPQERAALYRAKATTAVPPAVVETSPASTTTDAGDWPEFRGPHRDGIVTGIKLPRDWSAHPPWLLWRHPVGVAWSSLAVVGPFAFTQEQRGEEEAVVCYELQTGREVWTYRYAARFARELAGEGPRATPTVFDGRVYTMGATGILHCLSQETGKPLWSHETLRENAAFSPEWGVAASPLVYDDVVVVNPGGPDGNAVVAYHRTTGEKVWSAGSDPASYASPQLAVLHGKRQVLIFDSFGLKGHDAATGAEQWRYEWTNSPKINVAQPIVVDEQRVFIGSGYAKGSALLQLTVSGEQWSVAQLSHTRDLKLKFNNAVIRDGHVYGLDEGILVCLDLTDMSRKWKAGRYGYGQPLLVDDLLLIQAETGEIVLVEATPAAHREVARFQALEGGVSWNPPVLCRGRLLVRNSGEAACYDVSPSP